MTSEFHLRDIESPEDIAAAAALAGLAYTGYKFHSDAGIAGMAQYLQHRIAGNAAKGTLGGVFEAGARKKPLTKTGGSAQSGGVANEANQVQPQHRLAGFWAHRNFTAPLFGEDRRVGGLWSVSVALTAKKRGAAKQLVRRFLADCAARRQPLAALFPFRPDFYAKMGFGLSSPYYDYTIKPVALPVAQQRSLSSNQTTQKQEQLSVEQLDVSDADAILACRDRFCDAHHGMFRLDLSDIKADLFRDKGETRVFGAHDEHGTLRGFVSLQFIPTENGKLINDLKVIEFIYESTDALYALSKFLNQQSDQFRYIYLTTQDTSLYRFLSDPQSGHCQDEMRGLNKAGFETSVQSTALMYRVVDVRLLFESFEDRDFNGVDGLKLVIYLDDSFTPTMNPPVMLEFVKGKVRVLLVGTVNVLGSDDDKDTKVERNISEEGADAVLSIGIAEFSSLFIGAVSLKWLIEMGKAVLEPKSSLRVFSKAFSVEEVPINSVHF